MAKRSKVQKVQKHLQQKLSDLDDHLFLIREHLYRLSEGTAHLKVLSAELRALVCLSSGTEGLLWRLVDELKVSDALHLHVAGNVNVDHPLSRGLKFAIIPVQRAGLGDPRLPPNYYSLRRLIKNIEAVFVAGKGLTHEYLIKAISQQMGTAHEDEGIEYALDDLKHIFLNGLEPYVPILAKDAEFVLEIGERILEEAEKKLGYQRKKRPRNIGDITIVIRFGLKQILAARLTILRFKSYISDVEINCLAGPQSLVFSIVKYGQSIKEVYARYPTDWPLNTDAIFAFEYSSNARQAHTITNGEPQDNGIDCNIGWLSTKELELTEVTKGIEDLTFRQFVFLYDRLLSSKECSEILSLPSDGYGIWKYEHEMEEEKIFR